MMGLWLMKITSSQQRRKNRRGWLGILRHNSNGWEFRSTVMAKAELASAFYSQCTQGRKVTKPPAMLFREPGSSPSSRLRLAFAHPIFLFPFSPGLLGGTLGWCGSSLHHLQLHLLPPSQNLLGETRHFQRFWARGGLGRARGPPATVGGASFPTDPAERDVWEGVAEPPPRPKEELGKTLASILETALVQMSISPLPSPPSFLLGELKLTHLPGRCTVVAQSTCCHPALPMSNGFPILGENAIKSKPPV